MAFSSQIERKIDIIMYMQYTIPFVTHQAATRNKGINSFNYLFSSLRYSLNKYTML